MPFSWCNRKVKKGNKSVLAFLFGGDRDLSSSSILLSFNLLALSFISFQSHLCFVHTTIVKNVDQAIAIIKDSFSSYLESYFEIDFVNFVPMLLLLYKATTLWSFIFKTIWLYRPRLKVTHQQYIWHALDMELRP